MHSDAAAAAASAFGPALLVRPSDTARAAGGDGAAARAIAAWLDRLAEHLLERTALDVAGARYRIAELELYYHDRDHPDPFAHRHPVQRARGTWYLHRAGDGFRSGSFKGVDLTFGDESSYGGALLRSVVAADGGMICGPSLIVDRWMAAVGAPTVAALDARIGQVSAYGPDLAIRLVDAPSSGADVRRVFRTARVGLTLRRAAAHSDMDRYIGRAYRYLTEPRRIRKGRVELVLALHAAGVGAEDIRRITGSPAAAIERHIAAFEAGRGGALAAFHGRALGPDALARMLGAWHALHGAG